MGLRASCATLATRPCVIEISFVALISYSANGGGDTCMLPFSENVIEIVD